MLGINERTSVNLKVSEKYKEVFSKLREYIIREKDEVKDDDLKQEIEILDKLIKQIIKIYMIASEFKF